MAKEQGGVKTNKFDVIIIGAGVAGLSAAYHLLKNGFTGTIGLLEGCDRIGGRIHSSKTLFEEKKIEFGANWIHGIIGNPIYDLLYTKKIVNLVTEASKKQYQIEAKAENGKDVSSHWVQKVCQAYADMIKRATLFYQKSTKEVRANDELVAVPADDSLGQFLRDEIDKWITREVQPNDSQVHDIVHGLFDSLLKRETCISGAHSMDDVSLQYIGAYEEYLGGNLIISKGYYSLIDALLEDISSLCKTKHQFELFRKCKVTLIEWSGTETLATGTASNESSHSVRFSCENGLSFYCNHVIVTIPLGALKRYSSKLFCPPLPDYKQRSIERMGFDTVDKIFLEYSSKNVITNVFTHDDGITTDEIMLLWNQHESNNDDSTNHDQAWYRKIYSIYRVSDHCIQLWVSGKEATMMESLDEQRINTELTEQLRHFFSNPNFPRADNVIITRWGKDEYTFGSYSYIAKGSSPQDIQHLAMPIYQNQHDSMPTIAFAGEATHPTYFSTVHGAFLSGQEVAKHFRSDDVSN